MSAKEHGLTPHFGYSSASLLFVFWIMCPSHDHSSAGTVLFPLMERDDVSSCGPISSRRLYLIAPFWHRRRNPSKHLGTNEIIYHYYPKRRTDDKRIRQVKGLHRYRKDRKRSMKWWANVSGWHMETSCFDELMHSLYRRENELVH